MFDKYITVEEKGIAGQDARTKEWYCKELPFKDDKDLKDKIGKINKVLNEYNIQMEKQKRKTSKEIKEKTPPVKGIK